MPWRISPFPCKNWETTTTCVSGFEESYPFIQEESQTSYKVIMPSLKTTSMFATITSVQWFQALVF